MDQTEKENQESNTFKAHNINQTKPKCLKTIIKSIFLLLFNPNFCVLSLICLMSHWKLTINYGFVSNRLHKSIFISKSDQFSEVGEDCRDLFFQYYDILSIKVVVLSFVVSLCVILIVNALICYFSKYILNRYAFILYIIALIASWDYMTLYLFGPSIISIFPFIIRRNEHPLEQDIHNTIKASLVLQWKMSFWYYFALFLLLFPYIYIMKNLIFNFYWTYLLLNNKTNITSLANLFFWFLALKLLTSFTKYYIIHYTHYRITMIPFSTYYFLSETKRVIKKTQDFCFFLISIKLIVDIILHLFSYNTTIQLKTVYFCIGGVFIYIHCFVSFPKLIFNIKALIWEDFPNFFSYIPKKTTRKFYTLRNFLYYFDSLQKEVCGMLLWNVEGRVLLIHILGLQFFKILIGLVPLDIIFTGLNKNCNSGFSSMIISNQMVMNRIVFLKYFLWAPYGYLIICLQTGLISTLIYKEWYKEWQIKELEAFVKY
ncbi:hypothetical protein CDIK_0084 [Cucumispora dikerogammari]|nr:hypothetical protein CDIK_0084 [Cucumispora dikerogammari]